MAAFLVLDRLGKSFGATRVLHALSLAIGKGEVLALLGPSGSGKTTALRLIAGFETLDPGAGRILVEGEDVTSLPPARRNFGMVFQHYALFPHLTVGENVAFGLEARKLDRGQVKKRVAEALALVDLPGFAARRVGEISGGQQQRVALARALAPEPRVLLLDEPLSNLDPALRERTRRELRRAIRRVGITTLLVTHEQEEAFDLGDRIAVLHGGELHQVGSPEELYERPATRFVASFVGRASGLAGTFEPAPAIPGAGPPGMVRLAAGGGAAAWPGEPAEDLAPGEAVELVVRPEALVLAPPGSPGALAGTVQERRYAGSATYYQVSLDGGPDQEIQAAQEVEVVAASRAAAPGQKVGVALAPPPAPPGRIFRRVPPPPAALPAGSAAPPARGEPVARRGGGPA